MFITKEISSSVISKITYHPEGEFLIIYFNNSHVYAYTAVTQTMYDRFLKSESQGVFLNTVIKNACDYIKVN